MDVLRVSLEWECVIGPLLGPPGTVGSRHVASPGLPAEIPSIAGADLQLQAFFGFSGLFLVFSMAKD